MIRLHGGVAPFKDVIEFIKQPPERLPIYPHDEDTYVATITVMDFETQAALESGVYTIPTYVQKTTVNALTVRPLSYLQYYSNFPDVSRKFFETKIAPVVNNIDFRCDFPSNYRSNRTGRMKPAWFEDPPICFKLIPSRNNQLLQLLVQLVDTSGSRPAPPDDVLGFHFEPTEVQWTISDRQIWQWLFPGNSTDYVAATSTSVYQTLLFKYVHHNWQQLAEYIRDRITEYYLRTIL